MFGTVDFNSIRQSAFNVRIKYRALTATYDFHHFAVHSKCPIFCRFVFKYRSLCGLGFTRIGTCSTIFSP